MGGPSLAEGQAVHHRGAAPAGWLEEEVGHWLETLEQRARPLARMNLHGMMQAAEERRQSSA
eukprot:9156413-Pyramimonas_sp.AAC.1